MMDILICTGRLGRDARSATTKNGTPVCSFSLAVTVGWGENKTTDWRQVSLFGKRAESLAPYLTKGTAVVVTGTPKLDSSQDKEGNTRYYISINASDIELVGGGTKEQAAPAQQKPKPQRPAAEPFDDGIPF